MCPFMLTFFNVDPKIPKRSFEWRIRHFRTRNAYSLRLWIEKDGSRLSIMPFLNIREAELNGKRLFSMCIDKFGKHFSKSGKNVDEFQLYDQSEAKILMFLLAIPQRSY